MITRDLTKKHLKNQRYRRHLVKTTKKKRYMKAGVNTPSPRTATRKARTIQSHQRGHTVRKPKYIERESAKFKSLISEGAAKYKKKIQDLHVRGLNIANEILSAKPLDGIDLRGANLTLAKLTGTKLNGAKLNGVNFTGAKLNKAKLTKADLTNATFNKADLANTDFTGANLTRAKFEYAILISTNFTGANLTEAIILNTIASPANLPIFRNTNLTRATFDKITYLSEKSMEKDCILTELTIKGSSQYEYDVRLNNIELQKSTIRDIHLINAHLKEVNFSGSTMNNIRCQSSIIFKCNFQDITSNLLKFNKCKIDNCNFLNAKLVGVEFIECQLINPIWTNADLTNALFTISSLKELNFSGSTISKMTFDHCTINDCNFQNITSNKIKFDHCKIDNCNFLNAKLVGVEFLACQFINPIWTNADLTNASFSASPLRGLNFEGTTLVNADFGYQNLSGTNFRNANLTQAHFDALVVNGRVIPVEFDIHTNFEGARLTSANFQQAIGLQRHNFNGLIMNGALFVGCDLTGSTFIGTDVRHTTFRFADLTDCDFTDALVDNVQYDDSTLGIASTVGLVRNVRQEQIPQEIHKAWSHVLKNETFVFLTNRVATNTPKPTTAITMGRYINETLQTLITSSNGIEPMKKVELTDHLIKCKAYYESWDFMGVLPGTNPRVTYGDLAFATLEYVKSERDEFKNIYLEQLLEENTTAHGQGGMSCAKGMAERLIVKLIVPSQAMTTVIPERRFHYNKLINLIEPLYRLPENEAAETAEPAYVDIEIGQALRDAWHDLHKIGSDGAFTDNTNLAAILANYRAFLQEKFRDVVMTPERRQDLNGNIEKAIQEMQAVLDYDDTYFEGGSRRRRRRRRPLYTRIFSMTTREFRRLF